MNLNHEAHRNKCEGNILGQTSVFDDNKQKYSFILKLIYSIKVMSINV